MNTSATTPEHLPISGGMTSSQPTSPSTSRTGYSSFQRQSSERVKRSSVQSIVSSLQGEQSASDRLSHSQSFIERLQENLSTKLQPATVETLRSSYTSHTPLYPAARVVTTVQQTLLVNSTSVQSPGSSLSGSVAVKPEQVSSVHTNPEVQGKVEVQDKILSGSLTKDSMKGVVSPDSPSRDSREAPSKQPREDRTLPESSKKDSREDSTLPETPQKPDSSQVSPTHDLSERDTSLPDSTRKDIQAKSTTAELSNGVKFIDSVDSKSFQKIDPVGNTPAQLLKEEPIDNSSFPDSPRKVTRISVSQEKQKIRYFLGDNTEGSKGSPRGEKDKNTSVKSPELEKKSYGETNTTKHNLQQGLEKKLNSESVRKESDKPPELHNQEIIGTVEDNPKHTEEVKKEVDRKAHRVSWTTQLIEKLSEEESRKKEKIEEQVSARQSRRLVRYPGQKDFVPNHIPAIARKRSVSPPPRPQPAKPLPPPPKPRTQESQSSFTNENSKDGYAELINELVSSPYPVFSPEPAHSDGTHFEFTSPRSDSTDTNQSSTYSPNSSTVSNSSNPYSPASSTISYRSSYSSVGGPSSYSSVADRSSASQSFSPVAYRSSASNSYSPITSRSNTFSSFRSSSPMSNNSPLSPRGSFSPISPNNSFSPKNSGNSVGRNSPVVLLNNIDSRHSTSSPVTLKQNNVSHYGNIDPRRTSSPIQPRVSKTDTGPIYNNVNPRRTDSPVNLRNAGAQNRTDSPRSGRGDENIYSNVVPREREMSAYNGPSGLDSPRSTKSDIGPVNANALYTVVERSRTPKPGNQKRVSAPLSPQSTDNIIPITSYSTVDPRRAKSPINPRIVNKAGSPAGAHSPSSSNATGSPTSSISPPGVYGSINQRRTSSGPLSPSDHLSPVTVHRASSPAAIRSSSVPSSPRHSGASPSMSERRSGGLRRLLSPFSSSSGSQDQQRNSRKGERRSEEHRPLLGDSRVFPVQPKPVVETAFLSDSPVQQNQYNLSRSQGRSKSVSPSRGKARSSTPDTSLVLEERLHQIRRELSPAEQRPTENYYAGRRNDVRYQSLPVSGRGRPPSQQPIYQNWEKRYAPISVDLDRHVISGSPDIRQQLHHNQQQHGPLLIPAQQETYGSPVLVRGVPQRGTVTCNSVQLRQKPIFKRGSLLGVSTAPLSPGADTGMPKRVSFTGSEPSAWPTRNGPAPQPPTRQHEAPHRPLPPIPYQQHYQSESESGSEAGEVQRILLRHSTEEEWNADGKGRGPSGNDHPAPSGGRDEEVRRGGGGGARAGRRDEPRRHTLSGDHHHQHQGGSLTRSMDLEMSSKSQRRKSPLPRGYPPPSTAMLFDEDPGIMSEVETSSTGFRRGGKQRSSLPVVRTPSKTLERPLGLVFLQYRNETKRALLPNEITSIDTVKALFVRSFPKQLTMEYLDSPHVKIYIHDSSKDMFYELEDLRSHLRDIRDRSVLRLFESADMNGGVLPGAGVGVVAPAMWDQDQSYFSEPEFDSEYQHQHIHKTKTSSKASSGVAPQPYYMTHSYPPGGSQPSGAPATLPRGGPLLRAYSPAVVPPVPAERIKSLPQTGVQPPPKPVRTYQQAKGPSNVGPRVPDRIYGSFITPPSGRTTNLYSSPGFPSGADRLHSESGYMSSPERGGPRAYPGPYPSSGPGYEDPYYSQYASRSGSITPVIDEEARIRVENMERQLANLTGLVQKALTQTPTPREYLQVPTATSRDANYRNDDSYLRTDTKPPKLGKDKSVSFEKSVSFSDEPPDMNSPKQHSPQHTERTERERHKPAPPPKPVSLSPGQYEGRHVYRDLHLTPEMYNQLRGLQKKAKDLRQEVRNLRRMTQAQAHTVRETIRDTFIKIRTMLLMGGDDAWMSGDAEKVRLNREEDAYKQEMLRLEKDLTELESTVEELRGNVINRKTRVNMSDVENMALILSKSSKTVADLKVRFPSLQEGMKSLLSSEMEKVVREEKFLKEEPERLESALRRCKKLTGTLVTLKRLASVQEQRLPPTTTDGRLSPTMGTDSDPPITPPAHGKTSTIPARGVLAPSVGSGSDISLSRQRPENALDALLDELQTFARPPHNPTMSEIGRKGSIDSAHPPSGPSSLPGTSSLRRLHSYPSSSDGGGNSPPTVPLSRLQVTGPADPPKSPATSPKPPVPERNSELLSHLAGRRVPPPPPPRTSSRSPLASPTSPSLPPRGQHPPNQPQMGVGGGTLLRRGGPGRSSLREPLRGSPGISLPLEPKPPSEETGNTLGTFNPLSASNSSSCESVNSQEGLQNKSGNKARQEILEQRHQELLRKQRALQEQYARLQQLQRGGAGGLTVIPPPDLLLKKTGSESNLLAKMGLGHGLTAAAPISGSLTHLAAVAAANQQPIMQPSGQQQQQKSESNTSSGTAGTTAEATSTTPAITSDATTTTTTTTNKIYETDIL